MPDGFGTVLPCSAVLTEETRKIENAKLYFEEYYLAAAMHKRMNGTALMMWELFKTAVTRVANV